MALVPVNYVENETVIHASNLNNIQSAIQTNETNITNLTPLTGSTDPDTTTPGALKQFYVNLTTKGLWVCTDNTGGTYTWEQVSGGGGGGAGLVVKGFYLTLQDLQTNVPNPEIGDAYGVGQEAPYTIYIWDGSTWVDNGTLKGEKGDNGEDGEDGEDGFSPEVTITSIAGGHRVTITDADHPQGQSFDVMNGTGSGDMLASVYDSTSAVANAGGIVQYVADNGGKIDKIQVNGVDQTITNKVVNLMPNASDVAYGQSTVSATLDAQAISIAEKITTPSGGSVGDVLKKTASGTEWGQGGGGTAEDITYDSTATYSDGTIGKEVKEHSSQIVLKADKTAITNPNLLDNPWFTVNQRGVSSWSTAYGVDRWLVQTNNTTITATINSTNGIDLNSVVVSQDNPIAMLRQKLEADLTSRLIGKTMTISVNVDGTILSSTGVIGQTFTLQLSSSWYVNISVNDSNLCVDIRRDGSGSINNIIAVKLELGSISTLAMDTAPNYAEELLKCQRYCYVFKGSMNVFVGYGRTTASTFIFNVNLPTRMRDTPTISCSSTPNWFISLGNSYLSSSSIPTIEKFAYYCLSLRVLISSTTEYRVGVIEFNSTYNLIISADL